MSNKEVIASHVNELGYKLGCYDNDINQLSKRSLNRILSNIEEEFTDIEVSFNKNKYIIEIETVDQEKDLYMISKQEYIDKYGN